MTEELLWQFEDLAQASSFPWAADAGRTIAHTALWVNVELTKNIAEIGQLRLLRALGTAWVYALASI
jgi:hypothetical protein